MAHAFTKLLYHLVWSTKERRPFIDEKLKERLFPYMGGIVRDLHGSAVIVGGTADHVHILARLPQTIALSDVVRDIKANSSGWVHGEWREHQEFAWQTGYAAFTVSASNQDQVFKYVERQEEHHRKRSFEDEFLALLQRHGIEYDPRFVFD